MCDSQDSSCLRRCRKSLGNRPLLGEWTTDRRIDRFLVGEFLDYLREENLMDPDRVSPEHLVAFAHHTEAFEALGLVCDEAAVFVGANWNQLQETDSKGGETWWVYPRDPLERNPTHATADFGSRPSAG
jgi:hypothetical protein